MVQSWPGNPGVTDPFLAPSASPGSRRQVGVPIPFREAEVLRVGLFFHCWWALFGNRAAENNDEGDSVRGRSRAGLKFQTAGWTAVQFVPDT